MPAAEWPTIEFPPQPLLHDTSCPEAEGGTQVKGNPKPKYNWAFTHRCVTPRSMSFVVVPMTFEPHPYEASQIWPATASRALCKVCRSTHEGELSLSGSHIGKWHGRPAEGGAQ